MRAKGSNVGVGRAPSGERYVTVNLSMPKALAKRLTDAARRDKRTRSSFASVLFEQSLPAYEGR